MKYHRIMLAVAATVAIVLGIMTINIMNTETELAKKEAHQEAAREEISPEDTEVWHTAIHRAEFDVPNTSPAHLSQQTANPIAYRFADRNGGQYTMVVGEEVGEVAYFRPELFVTYFQDTGGLLRFTRLTGPAKWERYDQATGMWLGTAGTAAVQKEALTAFQASLK